MRLIPVIRYQGRVEFFQKKNPKRRERQAIPEAQSMFRAALRPALLGLYVLLCVHRSASTHWSLAEAPLPRAVPQQAALRLRGAGDAADAAAIASPAAGAARPVRGEARRESTGTFACPARTLERRGRGPRGGGGRKGGPNVPRTCVRKWK